MAITKQKKEEIVAELTDLFQNAKSVVFSNYKGVSVKDFGALRGDLRKKEVAYKVAKKTLIKLAAEKAGFKEIPEEFFEGQIGTAFSQGDEIAAAKTLYEFSKSNGNLKLLGALMEGRSLSQEEILQLAKIPGKEELLAKMVATLKSPISGFHATLSSLLRNFVGVVSAYKEKMEKEAPVEKKPAEEVKAEEEVKVEEAPKEETKSEEPAEEAKVEEPTPPAEKAEEPAPAKEEAPAEEAKTDEPAAEEEAPPAEKAKEPKAEEPKEEEKQ